jgi:hypothetical protein
MLSGELDRSRRASNYRCLSPITGTFDCLRNTQSVAPLCWEKVHILSKRMFLWPQKAAIAKPVMLHRLRMRAALKQLNELWCVCLLPTFTLRFEGNATYNSPMEGFSGLHA